MRKVRLEDIFEFIRNGAQIKQFDGAGIPITRIETISNLKIDTNRLGYADIFNDDYQEYYLQNGDLLMSHINSPAHLGKTAIVEQLNKKIIHGMNLLCLRANHQVIPKYIFYYFQTQPFKNALTKIMKKSVNQASISVSDLKKIEITISSYSEQSNSVAILEQLDYQISLRQQQLQTLAQLVKSRFYEMFLNDSFPFKKIGELTEDIKYGTSLPSTPNGQYGYLRMNNITEDGKLNIENLKYIDVPEKDFAKCVVKKGDVLFNRTNSIELVGKTCVYELNYEMVIAGYIIRVRTKKDILNPIFLSSFLNLNSTKKLLRNIAKGAVNQANINAKELQNINIPLPPLALQNQFADFVAEVDKSQLACQKSLDELETLKKSLMQAYFG